jgi:hypothetical protein
MLSLVRSEFITKQAVARHQPVRPALFVVVEIQRLAQRQVFERRREQVRLPPLRRRVVPFQPLGRIGEDRRRVHPFMDMQRDGIDLDARPLRLARPVEIGRLQSPLQLRSRLLTLRSISMAVLSALATSWMLRSGIFRSDSAISAIIASAACSL